MRELTRGRPLMSAGMVGLVYVLSSALLPARALALPLPAILGGEAATAPPAATQQPSDYSRRVVAYINGNIPVTRQDLGEYLIARYGAEKLELLVNKRIIELYCKEKGVEVTAAEVDQTMADDLKDLGGIKPKDFVDQVLKAHNMNLYEWKEDIIRPKLLLTKLCRARVHVTEQDLKDAFEAHYGEQLQCRIILFPKGQESQALLIHPKVRDNEEEFNRQARQQASQSLAQLGGKIRPIGRHTTGNEAFEKEAFSLKPGEVSAVVGTPEGPVIIKCDERIPPKTDKTLDGERATLEKEVFDRKVVAEIPVLFKELRDQAHPTMILRKYTSEDDWLRDIRQELSSDPATAGSGLAPKAH